MSFHEDIFGGRNAKTVLINGRFKLLGYEGE